MRLNDHGWRGRKNLERGWAERLGRSLLQLSSTKMIIAEVKGQTYFGDAVQGRKERVPLNVEVLLHRRSSITT